jgi:glycosyltransferase involved in cell wall biosynthesis
MSIPYSVIIPTKGRPAQLAVALDGVFKQTMTPARVFVIVDEPEAPGEAYGFLENYGRVLEVIYTGGGAGAARARNLGLERAPHGYVFFLDDDDEWLPEKCAAQMKLLDLRQHLVGVTCGREIVLPSGSRRRIIPDEEIIARYLNCLNYTGSFSFIGFRKNKNTEDVFLDETLPAFQDHEFYMRLGRCGGIGVVREVLGIYHDHVGTRISTQYADKFRALRTIVDKHKSSLERSEIYVYRSQQAFLQMHAAVGIRRKVQLFTLGWIYRLMAANIISLPRCFLPSRYSRR